MSRLVVIAGSACKGCGESNTIKDKRRDYVDVDNSDEMQTFRVCRLCGHREIIKTRMTVRKRARQDKLAGLADLINELTNRGQ
jgi:Zn ribbon nucleic-acid-binding protein